MAYCVDASPAVGEHNEIHDSALNGLGVERRFSDGVTYKYLLGVGSTVAGSWVTVGAANATALLASGANGRVAVASAAVVAAKYGWYAIDGIVSNALGSSNGTIASGGGQLQVGTTGYVQAQGSSIGAAAGDYIFGAYAYSAQPSSADDIIASVYLNRPYLAQAVAVATS